MSDRTFRLILDGKKGGLVKGSSPSSAAKKACKKLSAETGKTSFKFELQETTKDSKKKVYGPYKGSLVKDKIKVKMVGGGTSEINSELPARRTTNYILSNGHSRVPTSAPKTHYGLPTAASVLNQMKTNNGQFESQKRQKNKASTLHRRESRKVKNSMQNDPNIPILPKSNKGLTYHKNENQIIKAYNSLTNIESTAIEMAKNRIIANKGRNFYENPKHSEFVKRVTERIAKTLAEKRARGPINTNNRYKKTSNKIYPLTEHGEENNYVNL